MSDKNGIVFTFLQITLMSGILENNQILSSASVFNLLCYHPSHSLQKSPLDSYKRVRVKKTNMVSVSLGKEF